MVENFDREAGDGMEVKLNESFENVLLGRKEVKFKISFSGATPKREEIIRSISEKLSAKPELIVLRNMRNVFGSKVMHGKAHVYKDAKKLREIEPEFIVKRYLRGETSGEEKEEGKEKREKTKKET